MIELHPFPQRSDEWFAMRRGLVTASGVSKIITPTGKLSVKADDYIAELLSVWFETDIEEEPIVTPWMERGIILEEEARDWFALSKGWQIEQVGFISNDELKAGVSPDGVIGSPPQMVLLEIKCPKPAKHIGYLLKGELPSEHKIQCHAALAISEAQKLFFVSYCPGIPSLVIEVTPDAFTDTVRKAITEFQQRRYVAFRTLMSHQKGEHHVIEE